MSTSKVSTPISLSIGLGIGILFGIALEKARVYEPAIIVQQMQLLNFTMMKVFLASALVGLNVISILYSSGLSDRYPKTPHFVADVLGGFILGMGMSLSGSCPGTVLVQLASGVETAKWSYAGGMLGALVFGYVEPAIRRSGILNESTKHKTLDKLLNCPLLLLTIIMDVLLLAFLLFLESYFPWYKDLSLSSPHLAVFPDMTSSTWSPYVCGVMIGLLQIPALLIAKRPLGTSSSYVSICGNVCGNLPVNKSQYLEKHKTDPKSRWDIALIIGIIIGGYLSSHASGNVSNHFALAGITHWRAFVGGFLLLFGARLADGCTSGHGLSGIAHLGVGSFVVVASMFAGGIFAAFTLI
jgi:uncharacterized membrane protein YedE/YeeE